MWAFLEITDLAQTVTDSRGVFTPNVVGVFPQEISFLDGQVV